MTPGVKDSVLARNEFILCAHNSVKLIYVRIILLPRVSSSSVSSCYSEAWVGCPRINTRQFQYHQGCSPSKLSYYLIVLRENRQAPEFIQTFTSLSDPPVWYCVLWFILLITWLFLKRNNKSYKKHRARTVTIGVSHFSTPRPVANWLKIYRHHCPPAECCILQAWLPGFLHIAVHFVLCSTCVEVYYIQYYWFFVCFLSFLHTCWYICLLSQFGVKFYTNQYIRLFFIWWKIPVISTSFLLHSCTAKENYKSTCF